MPFDPYVPNANSVFLQILEFNSIMDNLVLSTENDSISWSASSDNLYPVKSCYGLLNDGGLRSIYGLDIWKCIVPLKTKIFAWLVIHDKILSRENLAKKGWLGSLVCVFFGCAVESTRHIFFAVPSSWGGVDFLFAQLILLE